MSASDIVINETYNVKSQQVWEAITDKEKMRSWYFDIPDFSITPGSEFHFYGKGKEGESYLHICKVLECVSGKKLSYSWRYDGYSGNSIISFELQTINSNTNLQLTHSGLETFPAVAAFARENFVEGWTYLIKTGLKSFLEKV